MNRLRVLLGAVSALAATTLSACVQPDAATAPLSAAAPTLVAAGSRSASASGRRDTIETSLVVDPTRGSTFAIAGEHKVVLPAGAICDPAVSSYGPAHWDEPCVSLAVPITITARSFRDAAGNARVDFLPALRFKRTAAGLPRLYLLNKRADAGTLTILYCPDAAECVDESLADPELVTRYDARGGFVYRYIKHFSGYGVALGRSNEQ